MMLAALLDLADLVAAATPAPQPVDDDKVSPGVIALVLLVVMGGAVVFLVRSMNTRLRNIDVDRHRREQDAKRGIVPPGDDPVEPGNS